MLKKYDVLTGIGLAIILLLTAIFVYPGGSPADKTTAGFSWKYNFISNLFQPTAINGQPNTARYWAVAGMFFFSGSIALFFFNFSKKIPIKSAAKVVQYFGIVAMLFTFLIATPLHDIMVLLASTLFLVSLFYITVFVFKTKLHLVKLLCVLSLLIFYATLYFYGVQSYRAILPAMQKLTFFSTVVVVLVLQYFTRQEDFAHIKAGPKGKEKQKK
ncbi:MAG: hypothetical protein RLZZ316_2128 [Bacteroidota bacterium]|jgi:hypothetical protein